MCPTLMCATLLELSVDISVFPLDCELLGIVDHDFYSLVPSAWHRETAWYTFVNHIYSRGFQPQEWGLRGLQALEGKFASGPSCLLAHISALIELTQEGSRIDGGREGSLGKPMYSEIPQPPCPVRIQPSAGRLWEREVDSSRR